MLYFFIYLFSLAHDDQILSVGINPADTKIFTSSLDKTIKIWHANNYTLIKTLEGNKIII